MKNAALFVVEILQNAGYKAYFAGGCVRDMLLKKEPKDFDIATNARPEQIEKLFEKTSAVGKSFGVILAHTKNHSIEIATFRKDDEYLDGRRPSKIHFSDEKEDAFRRDFTINGMFFDPLKNELIDYIDGQKDLEQGFIRFIGNPEKRIQEDHLRILRAIRFKHRFGFSYDPKTFSALKKYSHLIQNISKERVRDELIEIFSLPKTDEIIEDLEALGILEILIPELLEMRGIEHGKTWHKEGDVWHHILRCLHFLPKKADYITRLATLFHDIAKPKTRSRDKDGNLHFSQHEEKGGEMAKKILERLNFSQNDQHRISWLVKHHLIDRDILEMTERRRAHWFSHPDFQKLLWIIKADLQGSKPSHLEEWKNLNKLFQQWKKEKKSIKKPLLNGEDLKTNFHLPEGKQIGELLKIVENAYLDEKVHNKEDALDLIRKKLSNH